METLNMMVFEYPILISLDSCDLQNGICKI